ncbi:MAG: prephenate dehydrogenase/arogenate dehydrogenase family protein [Proteobacteria bacterium]|nr:prephenate dehydrogenase/arogenate dehydrogenase family protein [Pseudomonadota bacterium]
MNGFEIGIIGGTGGIGKWFAAFFRGEGYPVHVVGRREGMPIPELARRCRVVIISVPIAATLDVIRLVGPHLPEDSLLMDFTSLKEEPVRAMLEATTAEVIGSHPLFGPDCPSLDGQNVVLCPGRGERWLVWLEGLLANGGARVTVTTPAEHDRMMSLVQGLTHLETILMGLTLRDSGVAPSALDAFSTPNFRTKRAIVEKVFGASPELYAGLLAGNPNMQGILEIYERNLSLLKELVLNHDAEGLAALLKKQ